MTNTSSLDTGTAMGWSLGDKLFRNDKANSWGSSSLRPRFQIRGTVQTTTPTPTNAAPEFAATTLTRSIAENTAADVNVGAVIPAATDTDSGDTLTYTMEGMDAAEFNFNATTRQITTKTGVTYDFEAKSSYSVTIKVSDGTDTDTVAVTITLTDVNEPPSAPAAPTVAATSGSTTSLDVSWTAPANSGKPAIASYDLQYRAGSSGSFTDGPQNVTGTSTAIASLNAGTSYQVQVRATNDEGDSGWSSSGSGSTSATTPTNNAPIVENPIPDQTAPVGGAFNYNYNLPFNTFSDPDTGDTLSYAATKADGMDLPTWLTFFPNSRTFSGTPAASDVGVVSVKVTASDGKGGSVSDVFDITVEVDTTPPTLTSADVASNGTQITLVFSEPMQSVSAAPSDFTVTADGIAVTVSAVNASPNPVHNDRVFLAVSPVFIRQGQDVVVTYIDPTTGDDTSAIQDAAGNDAATFTTGMSGVAAVTNNSENAAVAPDTPTGLTATASGTTTINLSWTAPVDNGGSVITGYKIEISTDSGATWTDQVANTASTTTTYEHTGLAASTTRHYRVSAINSIGTSTSSDDANATTGAPANAAPTVANEIPDQTATAGTDFSYQFPTNTFNDTDTGDTLSYTATKGDDTDLPMWLGFDAHSRTFKGTPMASDVETVAVKVTADDSNGGTISDEFNIVVSADPVAHCDAMDTKELWCAALTVGQSGTDLGYGGGTYGSLTPATFTYRTATIRVATLAYGAEFVFSISRDSGTTPPDGLLGTRSFSLEIGTGADKKTVSIMGPFIGGTFTNPGLSWSVNEVVPIKLLLVPNNAPEFDDTSLTRIIAENTVAGRNVGAVIPAAKDMDSGDTLTYSMEGTDAASFNFNATTRQITTKTGVTYDFEAKPSYSVTIKVEDNNGDTDTVAVTINLTDVNEVSTPTDNLLVGNLGQMDDDFIDIQLNAQAFTTGANTAGYTLASIVLDCNCQTYTAGTVTLHSGHQDGRQRSRFHCRCRR